MAPNTAFRIRLGIFFETLSDTVHVSVFMPRNEPPLHLGARWTDTDLTNSEEFSQAGNRLVEWWGETGGRGKVETSFTVISKPVAYEIDPALVVPGPPKIQNRPFLESTNRIQVQHPAIDSLAQILAPSGSSSATALRNIHDYCAALPEPDVENLRLVDSQSALSTLRGQSGGAPGKARLFAALTRRQGLPARLVHGLCLELGSHLDAATWVEVRLGPPGFRSVPRMACLPEPEDDSCPFIGATSRWSMRVRPPRRTFVSPSSERLPFAAGLSKDRERRTPVGWESGRPWKKPASRWTSCASS